MFMFHEYSCFFPWPWAVFVFGLFVVQVQLQHVWAELYQSLPKHLLPALTLLTGCDQGSRRAGCAQGSSHLWDVEGMVCWHYRDRARQKGQGDHQHRPHGVLLVWGIGGASPWLGMSFTACN